jgi:hypothetical protein
MKLKFTGTTWLHTHRLTCGIKRSCRQESIDEVESDLRHGGVAWRGRDREAAGAAIAAAAEVKRELRNGDLCGGRRLIRGAAVIASAAGFFNADSTAAAANTARGFGDVCAGIPTACADGGCEPAPVARVRGGTTSRSRPGTMAALAHGGFHEPCCCRRARVLAMLKGVGGEESVCQRSVSLAGAVKAVTDGIEGRDGKLLTDRLECVHVLLT